MSFKFEFKKELFKGQSEAFIARLTKALQSSQLAIRLNEAFLTDLKFQVRRGISLATNSRLKPLSNSWIKMRKRIIADNGAPSFVSARKSNLSLSGQFLDSLKGRKALTSGGLEIKYQFEGDHQPYKVKSLKKWKVDNAFGRGRRLTFQRRKPMPGTLNVGRRISNQRLYSYLTRERPFIGIRSQTQNKLKQLVIEEVRRNTSRG